MEFGSFQGLISIFSGRKKILLNILIFFHFFLALFQSSVII